MGAQSFSRPSFRPSEGEGDAPRKYTERVVESFDCLFLRQSPKKSGTPQRFSKNRALYLRILMLHLGFRGYVAYSTARRAHPLGCVTAKDY